MEYKSEKVLPLKKTVFETACEQSIDTDFTLPDYYPEVDKVLKCIAETSIMSAQCNDRTVGIGGQVTFTLLYTGSDGRPNSFTHIFPFSRSIEPKESVDGFVTAIPKIGYINTKAVGPRKIEIHGSLSLGVKVTAIDSVTLPDSEVAEGIFLKTEAKDFAFPLPTVKKSVFVEDEIAVPQAKPPIGRILRYEASAYASECKYVGGKAVVKGTVDISVLYSPEDGGTPVKLYEAKGFSQIIDIESDFDNVSLNLKTDIESIELHPKTGLDGNIRSLAFEAKTAVLIMPFTEQNRTVAVDAFSGKYAADIAFSDIFAESFCDKINDKCVCKKTFDFGESLSEVYDVWCRAEVTHLGGSENEVLISGTVTLNILGVGAESSPIFFERPVEFEYRYDIGYSSEGASFEPTVSVKAVNFSLLQDGKLETSVELMIDSYVFISKKLSIVSGIKVDTENMLPKSDKAALTLYFPENETVWSIAKRYRTSPVKICEANGIDDIDTVCNEKLLVPGIS